MIKDDTITDISSSSTMLGPQAHSTVLITHQSHAGPHVHTDSAYITHLRHVGPHVYTAQCLYITHPKAHRSTCADRVHQGVKKYLQWHMCTQLLHGVCLGVTYPIMTAPPLRWWRVRRGIGCVLIRLYPCSCTRIWVHSFHMAMHVTSMLPMHSYS